MALPDEADTLKKEPDIEVHIEDEPEVELEIVDDTPQEDKGRKPLPEGDAEPTEEEMEQYSDAVKKRIAKMKHGLHDERRAKEAANRERDEAVAVAQRVFSEKKALEARYVQGEDAFIKQTQEKTGLTMAEAKREYKAAYEIGDADAMADAQEKMAMVALERKDAETWARQATQRKESAGQEQNNPVQRQPSSQATANEPDPDAVSWAAKNKWFGVNKVMTGAAYGVHDELVESGVNPSTSEYYQKLNIRLREEFPSYEWSDTPKKKSITSVVAPVNRTSKTARRVTLTQSQVNLAKRLGLTNLEYATELAKLEA